MNDLAAIVFRGQVRDFQRCDRLQSQQQCPVGDTPAPFASHVSPYLSQRTKDLRPIKALTLTVFAEIRHRIYTSAVRTSRATDID